MKDRSLSKESIELLLDHGYRVKMNDKQLLIKKKYDVIGPIILFFLFALVALPLFDYSFWLGAGIFTLLVLGVYFHRNLFSKASTLKFNLHDERIELKNKKGKRWFTYWYIKNLFIRSTFKSEYTSAFKSTNEEYLILIGVELKSGETIDFVHFLSDYKEPNEHMNEVYHLLENILQNRAEPKS